MEKNINKALTEFKTEKQNLLGIQIIAKSAINYYIS